MIKLSVYKTNLGLFLKENSLPTYCSSSMAYKINGKIIGEFQKENGYYFLKDVFSINTVQVKIGKLSTLIGYELKVPALACTEIPLTLSKEDVAIDDDDGYWTFYTEYTALYKHVISESEEYWKDQEFEVDIVREIVIENYDKPSDMQFVGHNSYDNPFNYNLSTVVSYGELDKLLTPEFLLHSRPCTISPENMFKIVRQHIRENIDGKCAEITSNYDFCMAVKRNLKIKPYTEKTEIRKQNGKQYSTPKFSTRDIKHKQEDIFNLAPKTYQSYNVASGWSADSFQDMKDQIKVYLGGLMEVINKPSCECTACGGFGVVFN
jgi:hypothetical protein